MIIEVCLFDLLDNSDENRDTWIQSLYLLNILSLK